MGYGLWVMVTKSPQTNSGNPKMYGLPGSMGYTRYALGGSLLYFGPLFYCAHNKKHTEG